METPPFVRAIYAILIVGLVVVGAWYIWHATVQLTNKSATSSTAIVAFLQKSEGTYVLTGNTKYKNPLVIVNALDEKIQPKLDEQLDKKVTIQGIFDASNTTNFYLLSLNNQQLTTQTTIAPTPQIKTGVSVTFKDYVSSLTADQQLCVSSKLSSDKITALNDQQLTSTSADDMVKATSCVPTAAPAK